MLNTNRFGRDSQLQGCSLEHAFHQYTSGILVTIGMALETADSACCFLECVFILAGSAFVIALQCYTISIIANYVNCDVWVLRFQIWTSAAMETVRRNTRCEIATGVAVCNIVLCNSGTVEHTLAASAVIVRLIGPPLLSGPDAEADIKCFRNSALRHTREGANAARSPFWMLHGCVRRED